MTVLVSSKAAPGVTTTALALAATWPRPVLLAECDLAGGDITAGFLRASVPTKGGLLELALTARRGLSPADVLRVCLSLSAEGDRVLLLPGLADAAQSAAVIPVLPAIVRALDQLGDFDPSYDVLVDAGRLPSAGLEQLLAGADRVLMVLRPTLAQVHHARHRLAAVRRLRIDGPSPEGGAIAVLIIGSRPYSASEVEAALDVPVVAVLADDHRAAAALGDGTAGGRWFSTSTLMRSAREAAAALNGTNHRHDKGQPTPLSAKSQPARPDGQPSGQHPARSDVTGVAR